MKYPIGYMGIGATLDTAIAVFKENVRLLVSISAMVLVPVQLIFNLLLFTIAPELRTGNPMALLGHPEVIIILGLVNLVVLWMLVMPLVHGAMMQGIGAVYLSRPTSPSDCFRQALRRWLPMIGTTILMYLAVYGGLLMCFIPGIILIFWFLLSQQVVVLENLSGPSALTRSKDLMTGEIGKAFVLTLLVASINSSLGGLAVFVPQPYVQMIIQAVVTCGLTAFGSCAITIFYFSCRCKLDNFDLQMLVEAVEQD